MVFIPGIMQNESNFKVSGKDSKTLVRCEIRDNHIVLNYHDTVYSEQYREMKHESTRVIDEFGRIVLLKEHLQELCIVPSDIVVICLNDENTIRIRPLVTNKREASNEVPPMIIQIDDNTEEILLKNKHRSLSELGRVPATE
jgi:hypothetical protein